MNKQLAVILTALLLSRCLSPYEYENCGVLYDKPIAHPLGTNGNIFIDTWGDVIVASRSTNQDNFFRNNACMLTGELAPVPD